MAYLSGGYGRYFEVSRTEEKRQSIRSLLAEHRIRTLEIVLLILLGIYVGWILHRQGSRDVEIKVIAQQMTKQCEFDGLTRGDANSLKKEFSLNSADYDGVFYLYSENLMNVQELLVVKVKDTGQLDELEKRVNTHLENRKKSFRGYGTNQEILLEQAVISDRGNYFFYAVSEQVEIWEKVYLSCI